MTGENRVSLGETATDPGLEPDGGVTSVDLTFFDVLVVNQSWIRKQMPNNEKINAVAGLKPEVQRTEDE